ncbi:MAG: DUF951 domain-containing protein [Bacilli bacterium]|nr:DUF951 domain-containing protein [Bacilli bacterium]
MAIVKTDYAIGDILEFKKSHPCGGTRWKILRAGVDCKIECETCKRIVIMSRLEISKRVKKVISSSQQS